MRNLESDSQASTLSGTKVSERPRFRRARKLVKSPTTCEEPVGAGYVVASKVGQVATTSRNRRAVLPVVLVKLVKSLRPCEEPSGQVYERASTLGPTRYDVRGTVGACLRRARKIGQVATTCEEPSGQVYVVRRNLVKSLRRARNRRGRFTSCEETWSSRYDVRGTVRAGFDYVRGNLVKVASDVEEPVGAKFYDVRDNLQSLRPCDVPSWQVYVVQKVGQVRYDVRGTSGQVYDVRWEPRSKIANDVRGTFPLPGARVRRARKLGQVCILRPRNLGLSISLLSILWLSTTGL
ncbi:hypothetical protein Tco_1343410 [Tanacetum coccineum]